MNRARPEGTGMFDRLRNSVQSGWNRLRDRARDFGERLSNGVILAETVAELSAIREHVGANIEYDRNRWEGMGNNFRERLGNSIRGAVENIQDGYDRLSANIGQRVERFRDDVGEYGLGQTVVNRVDTAVSQVQAMVGDTLDFIGESPLRLVSAINQSRANAEFNKMNGFDTFLRTTKDKKQPMHEAIEEYRPVYDHMEKRYLEFSEKAESANSRLVKLIQNRESLRLAKALKKIDKLTPVTFVA